jgi:uncharacterized protein YjiS (DUF1127 family)
MEAPMHIPLVILSRPSLHSAAGAPARFLSKCVNGIALAALRYGRERRIAADIKYLQSFDDRLLADIGLTRASIESFVRDRMASAGQAVWADALLPPSSVSGLRRNFLRRIG